MNFKKALIYKDFFVLKGLFFIFSAHSPPYTKIKKVLQKSCRRSLGVDFLRQKRKSTLLPKVFREKPLTDGWIYGIIRPVVNGAGNTFHDYESSRLILCIS